MQQQNHTYHTTNIPPYFIMRSDSMVVCRCSCRRGMVGSPAVCWTTAPRHSFLGSFSNWIRSVCRVEEEKHPLSAVIMMLCLPTWRLWGGENRNKKTSIRLVIASRLADVLFGMVLGFSAEFGRNTPTGASWYNRAAWAAIHPACLTPFSPLFLSLSTHPRGSLPLSILPPPLPVWTGTSWLH